MARTVTPNSGTMAPPCIAIKNFRAFQHYHDERPVAWIKLYTQLLDDYDFQVLPEIQQAQLLKLWLLAARMKNRIPSDPAFIKSKIGAKGRLYLDELTAAGWLIPATDKGESVLEDMRKDARESLEKDYTSSSPRALAREEKSRGEKRREEKKGADLDPHDTWLTAPSVAWNAINGAGSFPFGKAAKFLKPLHDAGHSSEKIAAHLTYYLQSKGDLKAHLKKEADRGWSGFRPDLAAFAEMFEQWNPIPAVAA